MNGTITAIKRFAVHDGDGIRTTAFLKGCPLRCVWCHNPEGISFSPETAYYAHKCVLCGACVKVCPEGAHTLTDGVHTFDRTKCLSCGKCAEVCLGEALEHYGRTVTPEELLALFLEDKPFYETSNGGITLSGGECLMQADFAGEVLRLCKAERLNTAVDTCGFVSRTALDKVIPYTDVFLYDVKAIDEEVHVRCTGQSNRVILENLRYLDDCGCKIEIRIPYVPGLNDGEIPKIAAFLRTLKNVIRVRILPYHSYAGSKYDALDMKNTLPAELPSEEDIRNAERLFS